MEPLTMWIVVAVAAVLLGVHGGYYGALADACLKIGTRLEGASEGTTGFQDAITPPSSTNARLLNWVATIGGMVASWYFAGGTGLIVFVVARVLATVLVGAAMKSDPPKKHFCVAIYSSMSNREADYRKQGDTMRADAMKDLRERLERSSIAQVMAS